MEGVVTLIKNNWRTAWQNNAFKKNLIFGITGFIVMSTFTYFFLAHNEVRKEGILLNDWVLKMLPSKDVSMPITFFTSSAVLLFFLRSTTNPNILITFITAYIFLLATRIVTIYTTPLYPPAKLITLNDPISNILYRGKFITRDLFYSGHTATLSLLYLCSLKKPDKIYISLSLILVGILLLIQHVHYTIDIVFAPFFAFGCFWLSKRIMSLQNVYINFG